MICVYATEGIYCQGMDYPLQAPGQLASHLQALRRARGLSQAQLGAQLGVGQTRIARIERDPATVSAAQLLALFAALGVQVVLRVPDAGASAVTSSASPPVRKARAARSARTGGDDW